jgi:hypothetical protein
MLVPFEQGKLDSLCGLYGIVNAERKINNSTTEESQVLFNQIIKYLERKKLLGSMLVDGMLLKHVKPILTGVVKERVRHQRLVFAGVHNPDLTTFWEETSAFLNSNPKRAVLLCLTGYYEHWTVIREITDRQMQLFDSDAWRYINRSNCTTTTTTARRRHQILAAQTYFLWNA